MNKQRRKKIGLVNNYLNKAKEIIETVHIEEECAFDNLPENLQCSDRGYNMEENIDDLEELLDKIDEMNELIDNIMS